MTNEGKMLKCIKSDKLLDQFQPLKWIYIHILDTYNNLNLDFT